MNSLALSGGIAIFAMLFGAGNIVFPLALGRNTGSMVYAGLAGFIITAILIPLVGLIASMLFDGNYRAFFDRLGKIPSRFLIMVCMLLLTVGIARCIVLSHGNIEDLLHGMSLFSFSAISTVLLFICTIKRARVLDILGYVLGPVKLILLLSIIVFGLLGSQILPLSELATGQAFGMGFASGYNTFDLIGTIFFSSLVLVGLRRSMKDASLSDIAYAGMQAGIVGGLLLAVVYAGFCVVAAKFGPELANIEEQNLLSTLSYLILGKSGVLANITVAVSCFATAVALTAVVSDFIKTQVFVDRVSYIQSLIMVLTITFGLANLGFDKIKQLAVPIVVICYPAFLVLSLCNIGYKLKGFSWVRLPFTVVALVAGAMYITSVNPQMYEYLSTAVINFIS
jgi:LIVCS family branched-chain amino acid:cation transporter